MTVFVDTSALLALLSADDQSHKRAADTFRDLSSTALVTHNYVVVESAALVHRRFGQAAARKLTDLLTPIEIVWIDEAVHRVASASFLAGGANGPSLVDCTSFEVMRVRSIQSAFAFDKHFEDAGFDVL